MRNKRKIAIVDSDAIIASIIRDDSNNHLARNIQKELVGKEYQLLYPSTTIVETITVLQRVFNEKKLSNHIAELFALNSQFIIPIDSEIIQKSVNNQFININNKKNTLFDCIVAQCAENYKTKYIFSFDTYYQKLGFVSGENLLEET